MGSARYAFESRVDPPQAVSKDMLDEAPLGMAEPSLPSPEGDALPQSLTQWQLKQKMFSHVDFVAFITINLPRRVVESSAFDASVDLSHSPTTIFSGTEWYCLHFTTVASFF